MITRFHAALSVIALIVVSSTQAQFVQDPLDQGQADTIKMVFTVLPDAGTNQLNVSMDLYLFNDVQSLGSLAVGFRWGNDNLLMTGAACTPYGTAAFDMIRLLYRSNSLASTNLNHEFQLTGARQYSDGIVASSQASHVATYQFVLSQWNVMDSLWLDSATVLGANGVFVDYDGNEYRPYWGGTMVIFDANRPILSNLVLSEDTLHFQGISGQANPPAQLVRITSDREPLTFSLVENASWLLKSPANGTTPQDVAVSVTTVGLAVGSYFDSIRVESPDAVNSPQYLYIGLNVSPPPPVIKVSPVSFVFNVLAGGNDPAPQVLRITNIGSPGLNWHVTKKSSWLGLSPSGGTDGDSTVVSVSVSGLGYGDYYDTISVSDPLASNNPVRVPVRFSVASDLPMIEVRDTLIQVVRYPNGPPVDPITFEVLNSGGGALDFTVGTFCSIEKLVPPHYIDSIVPRSGTAPAVISVYFAFPQSGWGDFFSDTLCVSSASAVNSPVRVVIQQRTILDPAILSVPSEPVVLTVYECDQGHGNGMPTASFNVANTGGDDPMNVYLEFESELFEVPAPGSSGEAPVTFVLRALPVERPLGIYYDTVVVTSPWAINKPQRVLVVYDFRAGDETPEIVVQPTQVVIPYRSDSGPMNYNDFRIFNVHGGCMPWTIMDTPEWLTAVVSEGDVPGSAPMLVDVSGYEIGDHHGTITVSASSASNNPLNVDCVLKVWKLRGDVDWNGRISIQDIACMIDYIFAQEHPPLPEISVGDVNCDSVVSVADINLVIKYLFETLEPLCGNPY